MAAALRASLPLAANMVFISAAEYAAGVPRKYALAFLCASDARVFLNNVRRPQGIKNT